MNNNVSKLNKNPNKIEFNLFVVLYLRNIYQYNTIPLEIKTSIIHQYIRIIIISIIICKPMSLGLYLSKTMKCESIEIHRY